MRRFLLSLFLGGLLTASAPAQPVLYDFYADWCGPCQSMRAAVEQLAAEGYSVQRVNVDRQPELAAKFGVQSIPCFVWVENGKEVHREVGAVGVERLRWRTAEGSRLKAQCPKAKAEGRRPKAQGTIPHPAWRYERAEGRRAAIVRIYCQEAGHGLAIGSGTLVEWNGRIVVLTARHVVEGAVKITVWLATGKVHAARVLKTDPTWDCAVLELMGRPVGVPVAEIEFGPYATEKDGDRLESCGYGPDGRLAVSSGLFRGYRRSSKAPNGPDDWMVISGHARPGDSGGPVFNARGRLVGVLWGTDGEEVVCVQAGRLHLVLEAAVPAHAYQQRAYRCDDRCPTPPMPGPAEGDGDDGWRPEAPAACGPGCACGASASKEPMLPYRKAEQGREQKLEQEMAALRSQISGLEQAIANQPRGTQTDPQVLNGLNDLNGRLAALEAERKAQGSMSNVQSPKAAPPGNAIEQKLDDFLHKLPVQGPVTKLEEKQLESGHPLQRFFGASAAIIFLTVLATLVAVGGFLLLHKIYQAANAHKTAIDAALAQVPGVGTGLAAGFDKLDAVNTAIDAKVQSALSGLQSQLSSLQAQVTPPAATTPAPSQFQPAAPPAAQS